LCHCRSDRGRWRLSGRRRDRLREGGTCRQGRGWRTRGRLSRGARRRRCDSRSLRHRGSAGIGEQGWSICLGYTATGGAASCGSATRRFCDRLRCCARCTSGGTRRCCSGTRGCSGSGCRDGGSARMRTRRGRLRGRSSGNGVGQRTAPRIGICLRRGSRHGRGLRRATCRRERGSEGVCGVGRVRSGVGGCAGYRPGTSGGS